VTLPESNPRKRYKAPGVGSKLAPQHPNGEARARAAPEAPAPHRGSSGADLPDSNPSSTPQVCHDPLGGAPCAVCGVSDEPCEWLPESNPSSDPPGADLFDDPQYTVDALGELLDALQRLVGRLRERNISAVELAREWDGLDLPSVVPMLREATRMIDLLAGHDWEGEP
jgi:hypothetical protein